MLSSIYTLGPWKVHYAAGAGNIAVRAFPVEAGFTLTSFTPGAMRVNGAKSNVDG